MKQLRNPWLIIPAVLIGNVLLTCFHLYLSHELKGWRDLPDALNHASFSASMTTIGWLFLRSPWAARITEIMATSSRPDGSTISETKLTITEPVVPKSDAPAGNS